MSPYIYGVLGKLGGAGFGIAATNKNQAEKLTYGPYNSRAIMRWPWLEAFISPSKRQYVLPEASGITATNKNQKPTHDTAVCKYCADVEVDKLVRRSWLKAVESVPLRAGDDAAYHEVPSFPKPNTSPSQLPIGHDIVLSLVTVSLSVPERTWEEIKATCLCGWEAQSRDSEYAKVSAIDHISEVRERDRGKKRYARAGEL